MARTSVGIEELLVTGYAGNAVMSSGQLEPGMAALTRPFVVEALGARVREMTASG